MIENAGRDATGPVLDETSHSKQALKAMKRFCIGMLENHECHDRGTLIFPLFACLCVCVFLYVCACMCVRGVWELR